MTASAGYTLTLHAGHIGADGGALQGILRILVLLVATELRFWLDDSQPED